MPMNEPRPRYSLKAQQLGFAEADSKDLLIHLQINLTRFPRPHSPSQADLLLRYQPTAEYRQVGSTRLRTIRLRAHDEPSWGTE